MFSASSPAFGRTITKPRRLLPAVAATSQQVRRRPRSPGIRYQVSGIYALSPESLCDFPHRYSICVIPAVLTASFTDSMCRTFVQGVALLHSESLHHDSRLTLGSRVFHPFHTKSLSYHRYGPRAIRNTHLAIRPKRGIRRLIGLLFV
jgi:hypothetical protein